MHEWVTKKRKEGGHGPSSKLEEDPILAKALARTENGPYRGETRASSSISVKHMEIDGRSIAVMFDNGTGEDNEVDS